MVVEGIGWLLYVSQLKKMDVRISSRLAIAMALAWFVCCSGPSRLAAAQDATAESLVTEPLLTVSVELDQTPVTVLESLAAELASTDQTTQYIPPTVSAPVLIPARPAVYSALPLLLLIPLLCRFRRMFA